MDYKYHIVITSGLKHKKLLINLLFTVRNQWKQMSPQLTPTNRDEQTKSNVQCLNQNKVAISSFKKVFSIFKLF